MNIPPVNTSNASTASKEPEHVPYRNEILAGFAIIAASGAVVGFLAGLLTGLLL